MGLDRDLGLEMNDLEYVCKIIKSKSAMTAEINVSALILMGTSTGKKVDASLHDQFDELTKLI